MAIALIVAVAIATRIVGWWNPVAHVDDQFYLLAGEELLKGHWPYIDVWDRKPLGLFLLYAGIAWIGGGTILGLNLVATAFAASTAIVVRQIALRFASPLAALLAALTYLFVLPLYGGQNGQSPVFYNLLIAGAALLLFRASETLDGRAVIRSAFAAMLLCGLAMTIKQTSFVEGTFVGLAYLWLLHRAGMRRAGGCRNRIGDGRGRARPHRPVLPRLLAPGPDRSEGVHLRQLHLDLRTSELVAASPASPASPCCSFTSSRCSS